MTLIGLLLSHINCLERGWGARIRTWDHETKTRCLTTWPHPITQYRRPLHNPAFKATQHAALYIFRNGLPSYQYPGRWAMDPQDGAQKTSPQPPYSLLRAAPAPSIYGPLQANLWSWRSVAQPGSAPRSGRGGRKFKSCHSDQFFNGLDPARGALARNPARKRSAAKAHVALKLPLDDTA